MLSLISLFSEILYSWISFTPSNTTTQKIKKESNNVLFIDGPDTRRLTWQTKGTQIWLCKCRAAERLDSVPDETATAQAEPTPLETRARGEEMEIGRAEGGGEEGWRAVMTRNRGRLSIILGDPSSVTAASEDCHTRLLSPSSPSNCSHTCRYTLSQSISQSAAPSLSIKTLITHGVKERGQDGRRKSWPKNTASLHCFNVW